MESKTEVRSSVELFSQYTGLLWHWAWLLILLAVIAGGTAYFLSTKQTPVYQSSTLVMVNGAPGAQVDTYYSLNTAQQLTTTYAKVMVTQPVFDGVAKKLGFTTFPLTASVKVLPDANTQLMTVNVTDIDPDRAALIANTLVSVFADQIQADQRSRYADSRKSLEDQMASLDQNIQTTTSALTALKTQIQETTDALTAINNQIQKEMTNTTPPLADPTTIAADQVKHDQLETTLVQYQSQQALMQTTQGQYQQSYNNLFQSYQSVLLAEAQTSSSIVQKAPAVPNKAPVAPRPIRNALLAAVVGLTIAAGIIFLIEFLDDTIRDPGEITRSWGIPVLGIITSYDPGKKKDLLIALHLPRSPVSEAFRSLRTNLQFASVDIPLRTLLVTSPSPEDGKTTVTSNLGAVIAQGGRSVVVVDADLRRPRVHKLFHLSNRLGLTDQFIQPQGALNGALKPTEIKDLQIITSGSLPPNPSELLGSERMTEVLSELGSRYDMILLDTPPILTVTDALTLAPRVDGVALVFKPSITKRAALKHAIEQLLQVHANLLGIVVNDVKVDRSKYYYYRGYSYYYRKSGKGYQYTQDGSETILKL